jgi:hypothetical protein
VYLLYLKKQEDIYKNKRNNIDNVLTCNDLKTLKKISPLLIIILITQTIISNNNTNNTIITC